MSKFKVGDRVVCIGESTFYGRSGIVISAVDGNESKLGVQFYDDAECETVQQYWYELYYELEEIYNTPLYKALL